MVALAHEAGELYKAGGNLRILKWTYIWPVIAVHLRNGQVGKAVEAGNQMLERPQQRLPDELEMILESARDAWANKEVETAKDLLSTRAGAGTRASFLLSSPLIPSIPFTNGWLPEPLALNITGGPGQTAVSTPAPLALSIYSKEVELFCQF